MKIRIGSRKSRLAMVQVEEVLALLKKKGVPAEFEHTGYLTAGDKDKTTSLIDNAADDFFTDALDRAVLNGEIDAAVHSAKDLPQKLPDGIQIYALTPPLDPNDAWVGNISWKDLPDGARIGTSSAIRQAQMKRLCPRAELLDIRGNIEERIAQVREGKYDGVIIAACALKRLGLEKEIKDILPWEAAPLQGQLAVTGRAGNTRLQELFAPIDIRRTYGKVILAGAGPGDPELITIKAVKALEYADCVFYDYLINKNLLKYAPQAEKVYVGKRKGSHVLSQEELSRQLKARALKGRNVVRLKGGDPLVFGRGGEEISYLRQYHIEVEVIPGISSATGLPSGVGVPLTARGFSSSVAFISGHAGEEDRENPQAVNIPPAETLVFLMGITKLEIIAQDMKKAGWSGDTPVMIVSRGTMPDEKIVTAPLSRIVEEARKAGLKPPALIIAGKTVDFYRPHPARNILYLGTNPGKYKTLGNLFHYPMIEIQPAQSGEIEGYFKELDRYDLILLTSRHAVKHFLKQLDDLRIRLDAVKADFITIGWDTATILIQAGRQPALVSREETSEGLFHYLTEEYDVAGKRILFPRSSLPNPLLKTELRKLGAEVEEFVIYKNVKPSYRGLPEVPIDTVIFTSPSTVENFLEDYREIPGGWKIMSKGPKTAQTLAEKGYRSEILEL